jgi:hypothetical protein
LTPTNGLKSLLKKILFCQNSKKSLLKIWLSIRVRKFLARNEPQNILEKIVILTLKSPSHTDFMV